MDVRLSKKSGHKFLDFINDGFTRTVCVDGWINPSICPSFCTPVLTDGWIGLRDDKFLSVLELSDCYHVIMPTCFGFVSKRGLYRNAGCCHMVFVLAKSGLHQYLYNYI